MTKQEREERKLQRMKELKQIEDELHASGIKNIAGIDEVGRGPLAGPVAERSEERRVGKECRSRWSPYH